MDGDIMEQYVEWIKSGAARDLSYASPGVGSGPRPHGSETLDKDLRVLDFGIERTDAVAGRLNALGFGYRNWKDMLEATKKPEYKLAAYLITNGSKIVNRKNIDWKSKTTDFFDGWDSSYHDAGWNGLSAIVGYGSTPKQAENRRNELVSQLIPADDPSIKRFKLRRLVREGD